MRRSAAPRDEVHAAGPKRTPASSEVSATCSPSPFRMQVRHGNQEIEVNALARWLHDQALPACYRRTAAGRGSGPKTSPVSRLAIAIWPTASRPAIISRG